MRYGPTGITTRRYRCDVTRHHQQLINIFENKKSPFRARIALQPFLLGRGRVVRIRVIMTPCAPSYFCVLFWPSKGKLVLILLKIAAMRARALPALIGRANEIPRAFMLGIFYD